MLRFFALLLLVALSSGCTKTQSAGTSAVRSDILRIALNFEPKSLNPILEAGSAYQLTADLAFDPLLQYDDKGRWIPALATEEPTLENGGISKDGRHITFHLRHGVRWQDGAPFTSRDVRFTYAALLNPKNNVGSREPFMDIASISTPDDYTAVFNLKRRRGSIFSDLWVVIVPEHLLARYDSVNKVPFNSAPIGTGPYRVAQWKRGEHVIFAANERYWRGAPTLKAIHVNFVPDTKTVVVQLKTGEADFWWNGDAALMVQLAGISRLHVVRAWARFWTSINLNTSDPILSDINVRRALEQGIDFDRIVRDVNRDPERRIDILRAPFGWAFDPAVKLPAFDSGKADQLLESAGWSRGADGIRRKNGRALSLQLVYANNSVALRKMAVLIASDLQRIGVAVVHKTYPYAQLYATPEQGGIILGGKYQLDLGSLVTNPDPDVSWVYACSQLPPHGFNYSHYCNAEVDAALTDAQGTYDRARRMRDYAIVQQHLARDVPELFISRGRENDVAPTWLANLRPSEFSPFWNAWEW